MIGSYGFAHLGLFETTTGWPLLSEEQQSVWTAYLRRTEVYAMDLVLRNIGAAIDVTSINPLTQAQVTPVVVHAPVDAGPPALNHRNDVPVLIPPTGAELAVLRADWDKAWKKSQQSASSSSSSSSSSAAAAVVLTPAEIARVTADARLRSAAVSGHGRAPHGSYASSSSPATLAADRERSTNKAIEKALKKALDRKKAGGTA